MTGTNGNGNGARVGTDRVKQGLAQMLKGGVIVSVKKEREGGKEGGMDTLCGPEEDESLLGREMSVSWSRIPSNANY